MKWTILFIFIISITIVVLQELIEYAEAETSDILDGSDTAKVKEPHLFYVLFLMLTHLSEITGFSYLVFSGHRIQRRFCCHPRYQVPSVKTVPRNFPKIDSCKIH
jgi:hypothetical protein